MSKAVLAMTLGFFVGSALVHAYRCGARPNREDVALPVIPEILVVPKGNGPDGLILEFGGGRDLVGANRELAGPDWKMPKVEPSGWIVCNSNGEPQTRCTFALMWTDTKGQLGCRCLDDKTGAALAGKTPQP